MTGYGKGEARLRDGSILIIELRTVNSRFFEMVGRLPETLNAFEDRIRDSIRTRIKRGRVNIYLTYKRSTDGDGREFSLDIGLAKRYYAILADIQKALSLKDSPSLAHLMTIPNLITYKESEISLEELWPGIESALDVALCNLVRMRQEEGMIIHKDLTSLLFAVERAVLQIKRRLPIMLNRFRKGLKKRVKDFFKLYQLNERRLEEEIAFLTENSDISEELSRTFGHIGLFKKALKTDGEAGKRLDFIIQEMHREVNTIGSKSQDFDISKKAIEIKVALEKIREQVQNVE